LLGFGALLLLAIVLRLVIDSRPAKPPPSAPGYYAGPMKGKGGKSYGTEDGRPTEAPSGTSLPDAALHGTE